VKDFLIDIPVLLLFFNRPETTKKVFEQIKLARPSKLYLYQDGAREGNQSDPANIQKCREIVEDIDWECEVHKLYQTKNVGCDPSEYLSQKWMFETEEMGIILEDDDVPAQSFFPYCKELLEKYKSNENIQMICGYNPIDEYADCENDYFFSKVGSIWGWATWKRVVDTWDGKYTWMDDPKLFKKHLSNFPTLIERRFVKKVCLRHKAANKEYYETINSSNMMLYDRLAINPKYNMISNIGTGGETTHGTNNVNLLSKKTRKLLFKTVHEYDFPLKHPEEIVCDHKFKHETDKALGHTIPSFVSSRIEYFFNILKYTGFKGVFQRAKKKLFK